MRYFLYIILTSAFIPATYMLLLTLLGLTLVIKNGEFTIDSFLALLSMILGIFGYLGLALLYKGLHKTNHYKKLFLLTMGLVGLSLFMAFVSPRLFLNWLLELETESLIGKWPIVVNITFLILITLDLMKKRNANKGYS